VFNEQRTSPRKILKTRATVAFEGAALLVARTIDVSPNGICLSYPQPMPQAQECELCFDLFVDGKSNNIKTRSKAMYCIFSNGEYKIGFQFLSVDLASMTLLAKYMR
jgi:hypothetical protein